ncbi:hypothetical protein EXS70_04245 [Candidatus Peribacteria bacterium]|nr:hypothetical protein [Candidatus Peribacteria bacterium]
MSKELSPDQTARIRDALAEAGDDKDKRARITELEAGRCDREELGIQSVGAHVPIQRDRTIDQVRGIVRARRRDHKIAEEEGLAFLTQKGVQSVDLIEGHLQVRKEALETAYELLQNATSDKELFDVIKEFSKAGDTDALDAIAEVYTETRPDLAVEALIQAGRLERAVALVVRLQRKGFGGKMKKVLAQIDSVK